MKSFVSCKLLRKSIIQSLALSVAIAGFCAGFSNADGPTYRGQTDKSKVKVRDIVQDTWIFSAPRIRFNQEVDLERVTFTQGNRTGSYLQKKINSNCELTYGVGFLKGPKIEKNKIYRITEVTAKHDFVRLELANLYNPIFSLIIECHHIGADDSLEKFEKQIDQLVTLEAKNSK